MIHGRIVRLTVGSQRIPLRKAATGVERLFTAKDKAGRIFGKANVYFPVARKYSQIFDLKVDPIAQKKGIASALFKHIAKVTKKTGRKFVRAETILHEAQVRIRSNPAYKSKFITSNKSYMNPKNKIVGRNEAIDAARKLYDVKGSTLIKKALRKK